MNDTDSSPDSDAALVAAMRRGELTAFDKLFAKHRSGLLAYIHGMLNDVEQAEDIVQDCFVQLTRHIGKLNAERNVGGWLYRVARNKAIDCLRRRRFEAPVDESGVARDTSPIANRDNPETPLEALMREEDAARVQDALSRLPTGERDVVAMHYLGGLTFREIAKILRRPLGTVLWRAHSAMAKLEKDLDECDLMSTGQGST